jgi:hypothetical protein
MQTPQPTETKSPDREAVNTIRNHILNLIRLSSQRVVAKLKARDIVKSCVRPVASGGGLVEFDAVFVGGSLEDVGE